MIVPRIQATTFLHQLRTGSTGPAVFVCTSGTESGLEYVVKFRSKLGGRIISEYVASILGKRLQLPVPSAAVVDIDQRMAEYVTNTEVSAIIGADAGPHFGTINLTGGYSILSAEIFLPDALSDTVASLFAFDMITQNYDRVAPRYGSPNILVRGDELALIDHEKAFDFVYPDRRYAAPTRPWMLRGLSWARYHAFYPRLVQQAQKGKLSFEDILARMGTVTDNFLDEAIEAMPASWYDEGIVDAICAHLREARENLDKFRGGLMEVFA